MSTTHSIFGRLITAEDNERSYAERHLIWTDEELAEREAHEIASDTTDYTQPQQEF